MSKKIYCVCGLYLGEIATGSKLKIGIVCLCENCNRKRLASDMMNKTKIPKNDLGDIFGDIFKGKI
ncbi:MAG: hypothetical protein WC055_01115 [Melioribacteraceae bacterium]